MCTSCGRGHTCRLVRLCIANYRTVTLRPVLRVSIPWSVPPPLSLSQVGISGLDRLRDGTQQSHSSAVNLSQCLPSGSAEASLWVSERLVLLQVKQSTGLERALQYAIIGFFGTFGSLAAVGATRQLAIHSSEYTWFS